MSSDLTKPSTSGERPVPAALAPGSMRTFLPWLLGPSPRWWIQLIVVILCTALATGMALSPPQRRATPAPIQATDPDAIEKLLERVHEKYVQNLGRFDTNLKLQAVFILLGLIVLMRKEEKLSFAGTDVPVKWLHWLVPSILLYLWLAFGFLLDDLIEGRHHGYDLLAALGRRGGQAGYERIFHDAGLIDGWFVAFIEGDGASVRSSMHDGSFNLSTSIFLLAVLWLLFAFGHAIILATLVSGLVRHGMRGAGWLLSTLAYVAPFGAALLLCASHRMFAYGGANPNWLQPLVVFTAPLLAVYLTHRALSIEPASPSTLGGSGPGT